MVKEKFDICFETWEKINLLEFRLDGILELLYEIAEDCSQDDPKAKRYFDRVFRQIDKVWREIAQLLNE